MPTMQDSTTSAGDPDHPAYTFETFVVSEGSKAAWTAAVAAAERPGHGHNPLFLHGPTGSGKSHLLHAISQHMQSHAPRANIQRLAADTYVKRIAEAIRRDRLVTFRQEATALGALLLDDIRLAGQPHAAEEIFRQIGGLTAAGVQVVLTADASPTGAMHERLQRTNAAIIELAYPDRAARAEILRRAANTRGVALAETVIEMLADRGPRSPSGLHSLISRIAAESLISSRALPESTILELAAIGHSQIGSHHSRR
ncbi:MAG: chromosomal replication initiator protein [Acidobacteriota bacterium]|nr:chromosomal replication initiator protein [Acidobacteriota bacterium]